MYCRRHRGNTFYFSRSLDFPAFSLPLYIAATRQSHCVCYNRQHIECCVKGWGVWNNNDSFKRNFSEGCFFVWRLPPQHPTDDLALLAPISSWPQINNHNITTKSVRRTSLSNRTVWTSNTTYTSSVKAEDGNVVLRCFMVLHSKVEIQQPSSVSTFEIAKSRWFAIARQQ